MSLVAVVLGAALLFGTFAHAQQQPSSPPPPPPAYGTPITLEQVRAAIAAAEAESKKNGWNHVFAVVDGGGNLIAFEKADLAGNASIEIGRIAATLPGAYQGLPGSCRRGRNLHIGITWRGTGRRGVPIVVSGKLIGAIGVSGATPLQDHQSAEAGIAAAK